MLTVVSEGSMRRTHIQNFFWPAGTPEIQNSLFCAGDTLFRWGSKVNEIMVHLVFRTTY